MTFTSNYSFSSSAGDPNGMLRGVVPHGNRSRLDSGTSGSSDGSRGSGKPPRRRSHRPRGCRGGVNRRRNNSSDCSKKLSNTSNETTPKPGNKMSIATHPKHKQIAPQSNTPPMQEFTILSRQPNSAYYLDCQPGQVQRGCSTASSMSASTAQMTDYSSSQGSYDQSLVNDFSTIQASFSDSSSEFAIDPTAQLSMSLFPDFESDSISMISNSQILPPLPSNALKNETFPMGPNPYALKLTNCENNLNIFHTGENVPHFQSPAELTATMFTGGYATSMKNSIIPPSQHNYPLPCYSSIDNLNASMGPPPPRPKLVLGIQNPRPATIAIARSSENEYRAERLEIQRQNVEGGSLFVTSPRSFLMGKRSITAEPTTAF